MQQLLPQELVRRIDWTSLRPLPGTCLGTELDERAIDLLCSVRLGEDTALLYFLMEHQSSVDPDMPLRFADYVQRVLHEYRRQHPEDGLPLILPILLHHSRTGWTAPTSLEAMYGADPETLRLARPYLLQLHFIVEDVSTESGGALRRREGLTHFVRLALFALARAREAEDIEAEFAEWGDVLDALAAEQPYGLEDATIVLLYTAQVSRVDFDSLRALFQGRPAEEAIVSTAKQLIEQGRAEGHAQGRTEGRAGALVKQLTIKFGAPTSRQLERIAAASLAELDVMLERVLTAKSSGEVLG